MALDCFPNLSGFAHEAKLEGFDPHDHPLVFRDSGMRVLGSGTDLVTLSKGDPRFQWGVHFGGTGRLSLPVPQDHPSGTDLLSHLMLSCG